MSWMGKCDMCAEKRILHVCGTYLVCDRCESQLHLRTEEEE